MKKNTHIVECPFCKGSMEVDAGSGKIVQKWQAGPKAKSRDEKFSQALQEIDEGKKKRESLFSSAAAELEEKKRRADELFRQSLNKAKEEGPKKPHNPLDFS